ncbi:MAG: S1 RNA-binding domain-containing protein [Lachnospira sp.]|nr:S1 RNA-binding domain-containing protein [Lachnospira sp.]
MSEEMDFGKLLEEQGMKNIHNGEVLDGTVVQVNDDAILLDIGYKSDGKVVKKEYTQDNDARLEDLVKPGDTIRVKVLKTNDGDGYVALSYLRARETSNEELEKAYKDHTTVKGKVMDAHKGLSVTVSGTRVFIPASLVDDHYVKDLNQFVGKEIEFYVSEYAPEERRIIGNRKELILEQYEQKKQQFLAEHKPGDVVEGKVKRVESFGAFIDLGGFDGLLHISEMGWGRTEHTTDKYHEGDVVKCFIKDIKEVEKKGKRRGKKAEEQPAEEEADAAKKDTQKTLQIALSTKFPSDDPWLHIDEKFPVGSVVEGKVARIKEYGAFVELAPGIDGLVHISEISHNHVDTVDSVLKVGQTVKVMVKEIKDGNKIDLSMKDAEDQGLTHYSTEENEEN